jgi:hypothetical protein
VFLAFRQTPAEFEGDVYRTTGTVFVSHRHPEHSHEALANHGMKLTPILGYYIPG